MRNVPPGIQIMFGWDEPSDWCAAVAVPTSLIRYPRRNELRVYGRRPERFPKTQANKSGGNVDRFSVSRVHSHPLAPVYKTAK
jgi:hypothetical protein